MPNHTTLLHSKARTANTLHQAAKDEHESMCMKACPVCLHRNTQLLPGTSACNDSVTATYLLQVPVDSLSAEQQ